MKLIEYFVDATTNDITERLKYLDKAIYELHTTPCEKGSGRYAVGDLSEIEIIDGDITIDSFHDKYDYIGSGFNDDARTNNIIQLCCIGICAYCRLRELHTSPEFINSVKDNLEMYLERANMPREMQQYYISVFNNEGTIKYLNDYLADRILENESEASRSSSRGAYTKTTAVGAMLAEKPDIELIMPYTGTTGVKKSLSSYEKGIASVLLLPALLALIYITAIVVYFIFIK